MVSLKKHDKHETRKNVKRKVCIKHPCMLDILYLPTDLLPYTRLLCLDGFAHKYTLMVPNNVGDEFLSNIIN